MFLFVKIRIIFIVSVLKTIIVIYLANSSPLGPLNSIYRKNLRFLTGHKYNNALKKNYHSSLPFSNRLGKTKNQYQLIRAFSLCLQAIIETYNGKI